MSEEQNDMEELTLSQAAHEFRLNRGTLNNWVYDGRLPARKEFSEIGTPYYLVKRADLETLLATRSTFGRPLRRTQKGS